ncbi:WD repeat-containing protein 82-like [Paramacrobiotus metropolitanus]|uniref:WD repeat-containing protein 82-like n=1 Tax=Paramacrobiotus metropolitanus TaxID=2943436 RepID=UPI0024464E06|nr:WD repeat-containing protein 82-like [Paramacrobiotus metropolitanus]
MVALSSDLMRSFRVAKTFKENLDRINHMDISSNGHYVVTSSQDESIQLYEADKGVSFKTLHSKKYGVDLISFTRNHNTVIHGSTKVDDTLRQLNLHENKYLRYFLGHGRKVTSLKMHPKEDMFLSASQDHTVRLWDLRSSNSQGLLHVPGRPVVSYDPEGLVFAVGFESSEIKIYDVRTFDKGPFLSFPVSRMTEGEWTDLKFNPDTTQILVTTSGKNSFVVDAFVGGVVHTLTGYANTQIQGLEGCYSPDGKYVLLGSSDGKVHIWSSTTGEKVATLSSEDCSPITCLKFNPKYLCFVSAHIRTSFWIPTLQDRSGDEENTASTNHVDAKSGTPGSGKTPVS